MAAKDKTANDKTANETTNLVNETRERFEARMAELQPFVDEANQIRRMLDLMAGRTPNDNGSGQRRGRRRGSGNRAKQFLSLVESRPDGISVSEAAKEMQIGGPNYLYRVANTLLEEGKLTKDGQLYKVAAAPASE